MQPATQLIIKNEVKGRELYDGDFGQAILRVKGGYNFDSSNGTLIVESQKPAEADVELATRSHSRGNGLLRAGWQYFGVPVDEASVWMMTITRNLMSLAMKQCVSIIAHYRFLIAMKSGKL